MVERLARACAAELPDDAYEEDFAAVAVRCTRPRGHDGPHQATVNRPLMIEWSVIRSGGAT